MNYLRIYNEIIEKSKKENRKRKEGIYYEEHHIIPKCIGGLDSKSNIIFLTAREHFVCHWLLHLIYKDNYKIFMAFQMMCNVTSNNQSRYIPSSRIIEYVKIEHSKRMSGDNNVKYWKGKKRQLPKITQETKDKIADTLRDVKHTKERIQKNKDGHKGQIPWNKGKKLFPLSEEHKSKISKSNMNKIVSEETKEKLRKTNKGQVSWNKGRTTPEEVKEKMRKSHENRPKPKKLLCEYCHREIPIGNYYQWHGDKCKLKN